MSSSYSAFGATIKDAYGANQPPAPGTYRRNQANSSKSPTEVDHYNSPKVNEQERSRQLDALKQRIHGDNSNLQGNSHIDKYDKHALGTFQPPPAPTKESNTKEASSEVLASSVDEPYQNMPSPTEMSAGGFPLDYTSVSKHVKPEDNAALLEKLNYAIHLLETQQDRRTATVTEELLLYALLGMFIICVLDNFARVGKYVR